MRYRKELKSTLFAADYFQERLNTYMDSLNTLDGIRNAFWSTMGAGTDTTGTHWALTEFNQGPDIAACGDWENGPASLRNPGMGVWKPVKGAKA